MADKSRRSRASVSSRYSTSLRPPCTMRAVTCTDDGPTPAHIPPRAKKILEQLHELAHQFENLVNHQASLLSSILKFRSLRVTMTTEQVPPDYQVLMVAHLVKLWCEAGLIQPQNLQEAQSLLNIASYWYMLSPNVKQLTYRRLHMLYKAARAEWSLGGERP